MVLILYISQMAPMDFGGYAHKKYILLCTLKIHIVKHIKIHFTKNGILDHK